MKGMKKGEGDQEDKGVSSPLASFSSFSFKNRAAFE